MAKGLKPLAFEYIGSLLMATAILEFIVSLALLIEPIRLEVYDNTIFYAPAILMMLLGVVQAVTASKFSKTGPSGIASTLIAAALQISAYRLWISDSGIIDYLTFYKLHSIIELINRAIYLTAIIDLSCFFCGVALRLLKTS